MASPEELVKLTDYLNEIGRFMRENGRHAQCYEGVTLFDSEIRTLWEIARREGITQAELSQQMCQTKGATSAVVDKLENKGLARRIKNDTRCMLYLTELGRRLYRNKSVQDLRTANQIVEELPVELEDLAAANEVLKALVVYYRGEYQRRISQTDR